MKISSSIQILIFVLVVGVCLSIVFVMRIRPPVDAEVEGDGINDGEGIVNSLMVDAKCDVDNVTIDVTIYIGGSNNDVVCGIMINEEGKVFVFGDTESPDLIGRNNDFMTDLCDGFISVISKDDEILWSKYYAVHNTLVTGINAACLSHEDGAMFITGSYRNMPGRVDDKIPDDGSFVSKISNDGNILWTIYLGSLGGRTNTNDIIISKDGNIFVKGLTRSAEMNGKINEKKYDEEIFISKITPDGDIVWSRYLGIEAEIVNFRPRRGMEVFSNGDICISGSTITNEMPAKMNDISGRTDAFIARLTPDGNILWSLYVGGGGDDGGNDIKLDSQENIYLAGNTTRGLSRTEAQLIKDIPAAVNARYSNRDAFISKISADGEILWSKYFGGTAMFAETEAHKLAIDSQNNVYVGGKTNVDDLPQKINERKGERDAYIAKLSTDGEIRWSYYYGGEGLEPHISRLIIHLYDDNTLYLAGSTTSKDLPNSINESNIEDENMQKAMIPTDIFIARIRLPINAEAEGVGEAQDF